jgi:hypothetical protein
MTRLTPIEELCAALHAGGFVLTAIDGDAFSIKPRSAVSTELAARIKHEAAKLQAFLVDLGRPCTPFPCSDCCGEFVSTASEPCPECRNRRGKPIRAKAGSPEEALFLAAYERREELQKNRPNCPTPVKSPEIRIFGTVHPQLSQPYAATT